MKKKQFNVQGTVLANIFVNGIEANTPEEAVKIFKDKFESLGIVDWTDWHKDIEVSEVIDYTEKVNNVMRKMGLNLNHHKVVSIPEIVFEYADFYLFSVNIEYCLGNGVLYFIVMKNDNEVYLPICKNDTPLLSFNYMFNDKPFEDNLDKVFFSNGTMVIWSNPKSKEFITIEDDGVKTIIGSRLQFIREKTGITELNINSSDVFSLSLTSEDKKCDLDAEYSSPIDYIPCRLTKIESII